MKKNLYKYTKNKVMTEEKLRKANELQSEIHRLNSNLQDLFDIRKNKIPATFNLGSGRNQFNVNYKDIESIIENAIQETEDNIRLFKRRFENL
ncbi:MAG: hypothetical protein [Caudoviricetes sp.]|nr:MAG: hypothetical protein [Caudoviricetes sp.]